MISMNYIWYHVQKLFGYHRSNIMYFRFDDNLELKLASESDDFNFELPELDDVYCQLILFFPIEKFKNWMKENSISGKHCMKMFYVVDGVDVVDTNSISFEITKI